MHLDLVQLTLKLQIPKTRIYLGSTEMNQDFELSKYQNAPSFGSNGTENSNFRRIWLYGALKLIFSKDKNVPWLDPTA